MPYWRRSLRLLAVLLLALSTVSVTAGPASAVPPYTLDERAMAIASPSLVYLETQFVGYVRDKQTKDALFPSPITYARRCSGFVINPEGHVVSTRTCVQPPDETIRQQVLYQVGRDLVGQRQLDPAQLDAWVANLLNTTVFTGIVPDSEPEARLFAQFNIAAGALTESPAVRGTVTKVIDPHEGNVAVIKVEATNLAAAELAPNGDLTTASRVLTMGFNTTDAEHRVGKYTLESKPVQVVGEGKRGALTYYKINEQLGIFSHGGLAIDTSGRVVGMVDEDPALPNNQNRAVTHISAISLLLEEAGVSNTLGEYDKLYRSGLDSYFNGKYSNAIGQLEKVAANVPTNQSAPTYRQYAVDRQRIEGDSGSSGVLVGVLSAIGGALLVAVAAVLIVYAGRRRRRDAEDGYGAELPFQLSPVPGAAMSGAPISGAPMSGAPMSGAPMSGAPMSGAPMSGAPISGPPVAEPPMAEPPTTWTPMPNAPISPGFGRPDWDFDGPTTQYPAQPGTYQPSQYVPGPPQPGTYTPPQPGTYTPPQQGTYTPPQQAQYSAEPPVYRPEEPTVPQSPVPPGQPVSPGQPVPPGQPVSPGQPGQPVSPGQPGWSNDQLTWPPNTQPWPGEQPPPPPNNNDSEQGPRPASPWSPPPPAR